MRRLVAIAAFLIFFRLGCALKIEPFYTYFYLFAWSSYLLAIAPRTRPKILWLACLSTSIWLIFEAFNFRLHNWSYIGVPKELWIRWPGYALSFATVMPGILWTAQLLNDIGNRDRDRDRDRDREGHESESPTLSLSRYATPVILTGVLMISLCLVWPRLFFPLVWGGVFFLVEPYVQRSGGHSLILDWKAGRWRKTIELLMAGLICGMFWEFCNYWAGAKWVYHLPYWNFGKIFEMPVLGFIGFPAFALEVFALFEAAKDLWSGMSGPMKSFVKIGVVLFWTFAFTGIDRWTVVAWR